MRLTFRKQPIPFTWGLKRFSLAGLVVCISCTTSSYAQEHAPSYAPGSVFHEALQQTGLSDLGSWEAPINAPPPAEWLPPATPATGIPATPVSTTIQPPAEESSQDLQQIDLGFDDDVLIEPPSDAVADVLGQAPAIDKPFGSLDDGTAPAISGSQTKQMNTSFLDPTYSDSPVIPETPEVNSDELIEFDSECLDCQEAIAGFPPEGATVGEGLVEGAPVEGFPVAAGLSGLAAINTAPRLGAGASIVQENIGSGAGPLRNAVGRTVAAGKNAVAKASINTRPSLGHERVHTPVRNVLGSVSNRLAGDETVHAVGQLSFLSFSRNYGDRGRQLSAGTPNLFANGPDEGNFSGVDISYGQRRSGGRGWEARYIGFNPQEASDVSAFPTLVFGGLAPPLNQIPGIDPNTPQTFGLSGIGLGGVSVGDVFSDALNHRVTRDTEFGSFEFNLLRAAGRTRLSNNSGSVVELFAGLRGVSFSETTTFSAGAIQSPDLSSAFYSSDVRNSLFGVQIGGRLESPLSKGWGWTFGTRVGVYNNRVESQQRSQFVLADGSQLTPVLFFGDDAGQEFDFDGKSNELAFLGELDFGVTYQFRQQTRARVGFRGIAISNVAIASGQFEDSLFDASLISEPQASDDFIVGGFYFGVDHAF